MDALVTFVTFLGGMVDDFNVRKGVDEEGQVVKG